MDQLKAILEYKFWILAGLAILLPPIGWWAATDSLAVETEAREKKIADAEKALGTVKEVPNDKWIQGAKEIGRELNASVAESQEHLYQHQKGVMKFPQIVQDALDKCHLKYRQDGTTQDFFNAKEFFVGCYDQDWKDARDVVKPFNVRTGEGLVLLPLELTSTGTEVPLITRHPEVESWRQTLGFTAAQMYDVQEDVWFLRSLMQAIAKVNAGTTEIGNARIKRLIQASLRGGDASDLAARRQAKGGTTATASRSRSMSANFGSRPGGAGGGGDSQYKGPKNFDPDDIFGSDGSKDTSGGTGKKDAAASVDVKRWVEATQKYNKRGFVLQVVMDEREIPSLLTALSESPFPIEIKHVEHQVYTGRTGAEFSQLNNALNESVEGVEQTIEQKKQQQRIMDGMRMAFNVNYLAEVTVAGTLTFYNAPASAASKSTATGKAGGTQPAAAKTQSSTGAVGGKGSAGAGATKASPAATKPSATSSQGKAGPGTAASSKTVAPSGQPANATKTAPAGKSATGE
jgi:hypothetical protein